MADAEINCEVVERLLVWSKLRELMDVAVETGPLFTPPTGVDVGWRLPLEKALGVLEGKRYAVCDPITIKRELYLSDARLKGAPFGGYPSASSIAKDLERFDFIENGGLSSLPLQYEGVSDVAIAVEPLSDFVFFRNTGAIALRLIGNLMGEGNHVLTDSGFRATSGSLCGKPSFRIPVLPELGIDSTLKAQSEVFRSRRRHKKRDAPCMELLV